MLRHWAASLLTFAMASISLAAPARSADANVFAASSLIDVLEILAEKFEQQTGRSVAVIPGASSTLSKQILAGAPADFFISADRFHADLVARDRDLQSFELFGNQLTIIAQKDFTGEVTLEGLPEILGDSRLAIGDPSHVPAGIYAKEALENAGVWNDLQGRLAPAGNVRGAVAFVARGAAKFGIVYTTDAATKGVRSVGAIDEKLHAPIGYWSVLVAPDNVTADMFWSYVGSFEGQNLLEYKGFRTVISHDD